jgi:DNA-binding NarL/FixJ family response regulator
MSDREAGKDSPIRLVLADDHPFILMALRLVFEQAGFEILASCEDGARTLEAVRKHRPDLLILDVQMPGLHGLDVLREVARSDLPTKVIVLTASPDPEHIAAAASLGARGVLGKAEPPDRLLQCVREVHAGGSWLEPPPIAAPAPIDSYDGASARLSDILTPREVQIVELIAKALPNKAVAQRLGITEGTVKVHLHNIYEKLKVRGRMDILLQFGKNTPS